MKRYLNSAERGDYLFMVNLTALLETKFLREWANRKALTKDELKSLKTANTYIVKAATSILKRLDVEQLDGLIEHMLKQKNK